MGLLAYLKDGFILLSIVGLVAAGFLIAIRSESGTSRVGGLLRTVFAVSCVLVVLFMAQNVVGFHPGSRW